MKRIILIIGLYLAGILVFLDLSDYVLLPEQLFFNGDDTELLYVITMIVYFLAIIGAVLGYNLYLVKTNRKEFQPVVIWSTIIFLPLFLLIMYEYSFALFGIQQNPQEEVLILARVVMIGTLIGSTYCAIKYLSIEKNRTLKINHYAYLGVNIIAYFTLFYGLLFNP